MLNAFEHKKKLLAPIYASLVADSVPAVGASKSKIIIAASRRSIVGPAFCFCYRLVF